MSSLGLVECADEILACAEIDTSLTADRCVDRARTVVGIWMKSTPRMSEGREQAGNVADDAPPPKARNRGFAIGAQIHELLC